MRQFLLLALATAAAVLVAANRVPRSPMYITIVPDETGDPGRPAPLEDIRGLSQPLSLETFTQTPDGNWRTILQTSNGPEVYEYEPGTKFTPLIQTELTLVDAKEGRVRYTYHITNDTGSMQQINHVSIGPGISGEATITRLPLGWGSSAFTSWVAVHRFALSGGIQPGSTDIVEIEGQLPGAVEIKLLGNIELPGSVPDGLTPKQYDELHQLFDRNQDVRVPALAPTIPSGRNWPEANRPDVLRFVREHYAVELRRYQYPYWREFEALFELNRTHEDFRGVLVQLKGIAEKPVTDLWHQEMQNALTIIANVLLAGSK